MIQNQQKGFTLVEILVAMTIASVAGVLLIVIIVNSFGLFSQQSEKVQQGLNVNDALASVRAGIKEATAVAESYTDNSTIYTTGVNKLVLKVASEDTQGDIIPSTFDYFVFYLDQNTLFLKTFPDPSSVRKAVDQIFSNSVDNLHFQYFNSASPPVEVTPSSAVKVRITLTLKQKAGAGVEVRTATSEANLRND